MDRVSCWHKIGGLMDASRFDTLTRSLATSRRATRKTFLGAAIGALLAGHTGQDAAAACKKVGRNCDKDKDCCTGAECKGGECKCKSGRDECGGKCYDFANDENRCGGCATPCTVGETCCSGVCVNLEGGDRANCGACGTVCDANEACLSGLCIVCAGSGVHCEDSCCTPPTRQCCDNVCLDIFGDAGNCGDCGRHCPAPRCCSFGECVDDFTSDRHNCGACGVDCNSGTLCCNGRCEIDCGGRCCRAFERCVSGHCIIV